ncbi:MAG: hypothetical protein K2O67_04930 [Clostridia bacterium]|nr:hypothetical protein [Clostridia bacterium]
MKKKFILALIMACAAACSLAACSAGNDNSDKNDNTTPVVDKTGTQTETETDAEYGIRKTFAEKYGVKTSDTLLIKSGPGVYAVYACGDDTALSYETVGPITFIFPTTPHRMEIYYFGRFFSTSTAYDKGLLENDDWMNIAKKMGEGRYRVDEEKWAEIKRTESEIKSAFASKYNVSVDEVHFSSYGEYNGAYPIMISADSLGATTALTYDTLGGISLTYPTGNKMRVYYDGEFYSLSAAYAKGLLSDADLIEVAKKYGGYYLPAEDKTGIIAAYRESNAETVDDNTEVIISSFYGEVGGYYAISVGIKGTTPYLNKTEEITADGELFGKEHHSVNKISYVDYFGISLYKDGSLYTLKYAVENKLISLDDFIKVSEWNGFYFTD